MYGTLLLGRDLTVLVEHMLHLCWYKECSFLCIAYLLLWVFHRHWGSLRQCYSNTDFGIVGLQIPWLLSWFFTCYTCCIKYSCCWSTAVKVFFQLEFAMMKLLGHLLILRENTLSVTTHWANSWNFLTYINSVLLFDAWWIDHTWSGQVMCPWVFITPLVPSFEVTMNNCKCGCA